jgi:hypothetical protein
MVTWNNFQLIQAKVQNYENHSKKHILKYVNKMAIQRVNINLFPLNSVEAFTPDSYLGLIGVILGACLGALLAHKFSMIGIAKQEKLNSERQFRKHYAEILRRLELETAKDPTEILKSSYETCLESKYEYQIHLSDIESDDLESAWKKLYYHEENDVLYMEQYTSAGHGIVKAKELRIQAIERVRELIKTALTKP